MPDPGPVLKSPTLGRAKANAPSVVSSQPTTLNAPAGMHKGYVMFGKSLDMPQVDGPATVGNLVFAALSCE